MFVSPDVRISLPGCTYRPPTTVSAWSNDSADPDDAIFELHFARINSGRVEDIVQNSEKMTRALRNIAGKFRCFFRVHATATYEFGKANDDIQRRAQLMTHICKEMSLCVARLLGGLHREAQPGLDFGAPFDFAIPFCQRFDQYGILLRDGVFGDVQEACCARRSRPIAESR